MYTVGISVQDQGPSLQDPFKTEPVLRVCDLKPKTGIND